MAVRRYPSDLTDAESEMLKSLLPYWTGHPMEHNPQENVK